MIKKLQAYFFLPFLFMFVIFVFRIFLFFRFLIFRFSWLLLLFCPKKYSKDYIEKKYSTTIFVLHKWPGNFLLNLQKPRLCEIFERLKCNNYMKNKVIPNPLKMWFVTIRVVRTQNFPKNISNSMIQEHIPARVRTRVLEMFLFEKILRTNLMNGDF